MAAILKGYEQYLKPIRSAPSDLSTDTDCLFDIDAFLRSRDKSAHEFYRMFLSTQSFIHFIKERSVMGLSDHESYLAVFDDASSKVDPHADKAEGKLLDFESCLSNDHTLFIPPPELPVDDTRPEKFCYNGRFPNKLDPAMFYLDSLAAVGGSGRKDSDGLGTV